MKRLIPFVAALLLLGACKQPVEPGVARLNAANERFIQDSAKCNLEKLTPATALAMRDCVDNARTARMTEGGFPYMDLVQKINAANHEAAVEYAKGRMSKPQYIASINQNQNEYSQEYFRRHSLVVTEHTDPFGGIFGWQTPQLKAAPGISACGRDQITEVCETP